MHAIKLILVLQLLSAVLTRPIRVNDGDYTNNYEVNERRPNSHYNRLPQNAQIDELSNDDDDGDVDYEDQTDRPVSVQSANYQSSNNYYNGLLTENKIKIKRRRKKVRRPCLPIQSLGSPLFSNRLKRDINSEEGKTFGALLGGSGYPYYGGAVYPYYGGNYPNYASASTGNYPRPQQGNFQNFNRPQQDNYNTPQTQFGAPQYNHHGGYPCIPVSYGHVPHFGAGAGLGGAGGGLGFFGNGGLLDFNSGSPSLNYPQTVVINRPPLFGNRPLYDSNRPSSSGGGGSNDENRVGFWGSVVDKLQEFVSNRNFYCE